jgi:hypothetical protein
MRRTPPQARRTLATTILNRPDAKTMNRNRMCGLFTVVREADAIQSPAITKSKKAASATPTPELCEKARSLLRASVGDVRGPHGGWWSKGGGDGSCDVAGIVADSEK